jgi:hypothetical protein
VNVSLELHSAIKSVFPIHKQEVSEKLSPRCNSSNK